EEAGAAFSF
nr:Chain C, peptide from HLA-DPA1 protein [synthetic construct]